MSNLLEIRDASRQVSDSFSLRNANLSIGSGEIVGLVGANGAGKTALIRAALGLLKLDSGYAALFGEPLAADTPDADVRRLRSRVGVVFDTCPYPSEITVSQVGTCIAPAFPTWDNTCFEALIERFGLEPKKKVKSLSRGMGMKLQLACVLSHDADLLILDEATAGLDPLARDELLDELRDYASTGDREPHHKRFGTHRRSRGGHRRGQHHLRHAARADNRCCRYRTLHGRTGTTDSRMRCWRPSCKA